MKERPILFSAPMVRAIINSTKTQTRRIVKPQPEAGEKFFSLDIALNMYGEPSGLAAWFLDSNEGGLPPVFCPYGQPGDRLWVRETWARDDEDGSLMYRTDVGRDMNADAWEQGRLEGVPRYRWRPSIYMPRWASRITLEVTGVRVERLHEISRGDAMEEGCPFPNMADGTDPRSWYADLWRQINGPASWDANPWVWCIEFRRVTSD